MQSEFGEAINSVHSNSSRPNRWTPVEVWQKKGLTAQEMILPQGTNLFQLHSYECYFIFKLKLFLDVSIQTNSADKSKIYLKAGQKVIVLKSHKGICLQLESGKVIAIRASVKGGQQTPGEQKIGNFSGLQNQPQSSNFRTNFPPRNDGDVIDISNDDDEDESEVAQDGIGKFVDSNSSVSQSTATLNSTNGVLPSIQKAIDPTYKEKVVYKPNLVQRKSKMLPPPTPPKENPSSYHPRLISIPQKWDEHKNYVKPSPPTTSNLSNKNMNLDINGSGKNQTISFSSCKKHNFYENHCIL